MSPGEKNLRFNVGTYIGNSSLLFPINYVRHKFKDRIVHPDTDLCIEGFQRSGNSSFTMLFRQKNREAKIAHHIHGSAHVKRAIKYSVAVVVLIRQPGDALASLISWDNKLKPKNALKAYIQFYKQLMHLKSEILIADFEESTRDISGLVSRINSRFKKDFILPNYTDNELQQIKNNVSLRQDAMSSAFPNDKRTLLNKENKEIIKSHALFSTAQEVYTEFLK